MKSVGVELNSGPFQDNFSEEVVFFVAAKNLNGDETLCFGAVKVSDGVRVSLVEAADALNCDEVDSVDAIGDLTSAKGLQFATAEDLGDGTVVPNGAIQTLGDGTIASGNRAFALVRDKTVGPGSARLQACRRASARQLFGRESIPTQNDLGKRRTVRHPGAGRGPGH